VAGSGYSIALTSTSTNGATSCAGAAIFDVAVRATTAVNVALDCHEAPRNGAITVVGSLNVCPKIDALSATPTQATVGATVALTASAHDPDAAPNPLVYKWTATSGTFDDAFARNPTFTCAVAGAATITLTVNDSDLSAGCPDAVTTQVTCTP
jgi:PKD repeat protein